MQHTDIVKRTRNAINARLKQAIAKYGFDEVRLTANHYFQEVLEKVKLEREIAEREQELRKLKARK